VDSCRWGELAEQIERSRTLCLTPVAGVASSRVPAINSEVGGLLGAADEREIGGPHKGNDVPHGQPEPERYGEADNISRRPNLDEVRDVLVPIFGVASKARRDPLVWIECARKDTGLKDIKCGQVDADEYADVHNRLAS